MYLTKGRHSRLGQVKYSAMELGNDPDGQVARTIGVMCARANEDAQDPGFVARANQIAGGGGQDQDQDQVGQVHRIWNHVRRSINFNRDEGIARGLDWAPENDDVVEVLIRPVDMARYIDQGIAIGDCDDFSMYLAALLTAVGIKSAYVTVGADSQAPDQYSHVYVMAYPKDADGKTVRVACDASHGEYCGWEVPNVFGKIREWGLGGGDWLGMVVASVVGVWTAVWLWKRFANA